MKRVLAIVLSIFLSQDSFAVGSFVSSAVGTNQSGSSVASIATSSTLNVASGDQIVVACRNGDGVNFATSATDTAGNSYTIGTSTKTSGELSLRSFYVLSAKPSTVNTVTCNFSPSDSFVSVVAVQLNASNVLDVLQGKRTASGISITSDNFNTIYENEIVVSCASYPGNANTFTAGAIAGTNGTLTKCSNGTTGGDTCCEYRAVLGPLTAKTAVNGLTAGTFAWYQSTLSFANSFPSAIINNPLQY